MILRSKLETDLYYLIDKVLNAHTDSVIILDPYVWPEDPFLDPGPQFSSSSSAFITRICHLWSWVASSQRCDSDQTDGRRIDWFLPPSAGFFSSGSPLGMDFSCTVIIIINLADRSTSELLNTDLLQRQARAGVQFPRCCRRHCPGTVQQRTSEKTSISVTEFVSRWSEICCKPCC